MYLYNRKILFNAKNGALNVGTEFSFVGIRCITGTSYDLYAVQDASFIAEPSIKRGSVRGRDEWHGTTIVSSTHYHHQRNERMPGLRPGSALTPRRLFLIERDANIRDIVIVIRSALKF